MLEASQRGLSNAAVSRGSGESTGVDPAPAIAAQSAVLVCAYAEYVRRHPDRFTDFNVITRFNEADI